MFYKEHERMFFALVLPSFWNPNIALPMCCESNTAFDLFNFSVK